MGDMHAVHTCRWAEPTLYLSRPLWLEAWDYPWSCTASGVPSVLKDVTVCESCPRWAPAFEHTPNRGRTGCRAHPALIFRDAAEAEALTF